MCTGVCLCVCVWSVFLIYLYKAWLQKCLTLYVTSWRTVTVLFLFLSSLSIFPPPSSLLSWLQLYLCALGRLQRGALWGDAAAEIRLDPAEERREQVGQQRHPTVPRISGCRAVPPSPTHTCTHILRAPLPQHTQTNIIPCQNTNTVTPTKQQDSNTNMSEDGLSGITAHINKRASLESFIQWDNIGRKLEKAKQIITATH